MDTNNPIVLYISGPMGGIEDHNQEAFRDAARRYTDAGFAVLNPADNFGSVTGLPRRYYLRAALHNLLQADVVVLLPGWHDSPGAAWEVDTAYVLGLPCLSDMQGEESRPAEYLSRFAPGIDGALGDEG